MLQFLQGIRIGLSYILPKKTMMIFTMVKDQLILMYRVQSGILFEQASSQGTFAANSQRCY